MPKFGTAAYCDDCNCQLELPAVADDECPVSCPGCGVPVGMLGDINNNLRKYIVDKSRNIALAALDEIVDLKCEDYDQYAPEDDKADDIEYSFQYFLSINNVRR